MYSTKTDGLLNNVTCFLLNLILAIAKCVCMKRRKVDLALDSCWHRGSGGNQIGR